MHPESAPREELAFLRHGDVRVAPAPLGQYREEEEEGESPPTPSSGLLPKNEVETKLLGENAECLSLPPMVLSGSTNEAPRWMCGKGRALKFLAMSIIIMCGS